MTSMRDHALAGRVAGMPGQVNMLRTAIAIGAGYGYVYVYSTTLLACASEEILAGL
jgi:hypothetical protein